MSGNTTSSTWTDNKGLCAFAKVCAMTDYVIVTRAQYVQLI